jgi:hypothetical protein
MIPSDQGENVCPVGAAYQERLDNLTPQNAAFSGCLLYISGCMSVYQYPVWDVEFV